MNNYPPGVTGNESQITGKWNANCGDCGAAFSDATEDGCFIIDGTDGVVCNDCAVERIKEILPGVEITEIAELLNERTKK